MPFFILRRSARRAFFATTISSLKIRLRLFVRRLRYNRESGGLVSKTAPDLRRGCDNDCVAKATGQILVIGYTDTSDRPSFQEIRIMSLLLYL